MSKITRRAFIEDSMLATAAAAAAAYATTPDEAEAQEVRGANDTINVAVLGCRIRGRQHASALNRIDGVRITHVCDPDSTLRGELAEAVRGRQGMAPTAVADMRRVFDDRSVDAVFIATPNHWHALAAIWAMQAGKDVYVEKPVSHNVSEGRRIVQVARRTRRICQAGTQRRSNTALAAIADYIRQGRLGRVRLGRSIIYRRRSSIGPTGRHQPPEQVDYNLFCGPAPMAPLTRRTFHYDWHWFWDTGNGELGNNNIHMVDVCRWLMGLNDLGRSVLSYGGRVGFNNDAAETPNTQVVIHDYGDKTIAQETRNLPTGPFSRELPGGWIIYGSEGTIAGTSLFDENNRRVRTFPGGDNNHFANFLSAVRSRRQQDLKAEVLEGHLSSALCHIGNLSYRLGEPASPDDIIRRLGALEVQDDVRETFNRTRQHLSDNDINIAETRLTLGAHLRLHEEREEFVGNQRANAMLTREYRRPFVVPSENEVQSAGN